MPSAIDVFREQREAADQVHARLTDIATLLGQVRQQVNGLALNQDQWLYFFTLGVTVVMFVLGWNLLRGRIGRAMMAIRDNHIAAEAMGVDNAMVKSVTFGISAMFTGIAGALGAIAVQFVAPDSFNIFLSITFLIGIVIGGLASISGAIYGALFIQFVPNIADEISKAAPWAIFGLFLLAFIYVMPMGVAGAIRLGLARLTRKAHNSQPEKPLSGYPSTEEEIP